MELFDAVARPLRPARSAEESDFALVNRYGDPPFARMRTVVEGWFCRYPSSLQAALRQRFRSPTRSDYESAFHELMLHEVLLRLGYEVLVEAGDPNSRKQDFVARMDGADRLLLEAGVALDMTPVPLKAPRAVDSVTSILRKGREKVARYGAPQLPYVIAINAINRMVDDVDVEDALYRDADGSVGMGPTCGGVLDHRRSQWVSAVLVTMSQAHNLERESARLYLNPFAAMPVEGPITQLPLARRDGSEWLTESGRSLRDILGLAPHWPYHPLRPGLAAALSTCLA